ncbi:MAG: histidinol phosphatase [Propionibacteriaceae bacterium]|nr:histidinol phosphatase [Propionibacteriaceae bacterium]
MVAQSLTEDLRLAHLLADQADAITMARFKALDLRVDSKPDLTPVSDADIAVEDAIRTMLQRTRPRDGVHGEEGEDTGWGPRRWIIDPIDGTANFVRQVPVWATLIALMDGDAVTVAVVSAPALNRRWWASAEGGAFVGRNLLNAVPCQVSTVLSMADASLSYSEIGEWVDAGLGQQFANVLQACWRTRAYGDFWSYMLLAEGAVDLAAEPKLSLHDMAAPYLVVAEAGGIFTNLDGAPGPFGPSAIAANPHLHAEFLARLRGKRAQ